MGMEVIKPGRLPEPARFKGTCEACGTEIEAWGSSLFHLFDDDEIVKGASNPWFAKCPTCSHTIAVVRFATKKC
jgi:hypothetical protein